MTARKLLSAGLAALVSALPVLAQVQVQVQDPTRPAGAQAVAEGDILLAPAESGVQTVILRRDGKSAAVINGQYVVVGGRFGDKRVVKISESEVVLKGESGREVLKVTPAIEKTPVGKTPGIKQRTTGTTDK